MSINSGLDLKTRFVWEKKKRITTSEISILVQCSLKCGVTFFLVSHVQGTFVDFRFMLFTYLTFNASMKMVNKLSVSDGVYTMLIKKFLLFDTALLKCFVYSRAGIFNYPWCNNPCRTYQELGQANLYSFDQKFIYYLPTKNVTQEKQYLLQSRL